MRLIDADELKTHKFLSPQVKVLGGRHNGKAIVAAYQQGWNDAIDAIIDNAPTVLHDNYSMGYQDGVKKVLSERPQGEWITDERGYVCSECGALHSDDYPFCHMCGADMRKEASDV